MSSTASASVKSPRFWGRIVLVEGSIQQVVIGKGNSQNNGHFALHSSEVVEPRLDYLGSRLLFYGMGMIPATTTEQENRRAHVRRSEATVNPAGRHQCERPARRRPKNS